MTNQFHNHSLAQLADLYGDIDVQIKALTEAKAAAKRTELVALRRELEVSAAQAASGAAMTLARGVFEAPRGVARRAQRPDESRLYDI
jgi:hypothetical protein